MTGATGQVGAFVVRDLLARGHRLLLLVRGPEAKERMEKVFHSTGGDVPSGWEVFEGDLFSLPPPMNGIDIVLHSAAELSFDPAQKEKVWRTNFEGTKNLLSWVSASGIHSFHYVSTAYVAGRYEGQYKEESLDLGQTFRNEYERSKLTTEKLCHEFCRDKDIALNIYRPGIIMGTSSGQSLHYQGYYIFLKVLSDLYEKYSQKEDPQEGIYHRDGKLHLPIRIEANPCGKKHLVPLDYVSQAISAVVSEPGIKGQTFFLLPEKAPTNQESLEWTEQALGLCGLSLVPSLEGVKLNRLERLIHHYIHIYKSYLEQEPDFDYLYSIDKLKSLNVFCPPLDAGYFQRLIYYGQKDKWGRKEKQSKEYPLEYSYFTEFLPAFLDKPFLSGRVDSCFAVCIKEDPKGI